MEGGPMHAKSSATIVALAAFLLAPPARATDYALHFNGVTRARIPDDPSLEFGNPPIGTIEMWMNNGGCVDCHLMGKRAGCGSTFDFYQFVILSQNPDWVYGGWGLGCSLGSG